MAQDGLMIDAREVAALATAIQLRIAEVHENALQANADAEVAHAAATVAASGSGDSEVSLCHSRFSELATGIARSEAQKIEALEREAVAADDLLGRMQAPGADIGAMQPELLAAFGFMPLTPAEPSALFITTAEPGINVLCVARRTNAADVDADPTATWFASDSAHVNITLSGGKPPSCHAEQCATLRALAFRVRVSATLVPIEGAGAGALLLPLPLPVTAECGLNVAEDGVRVIFRVPEVRPQGAAAWLLRVAHLSVRDAPLRLGTLEAGVRIFFRHHHSASCNHFSSPWTVGEVYNAAVAGDVQRLTLALGNRGSTGEKNGGGMTPLMAASCHGHLDAALELMEAGADPTATMSGGRTALHWAAFYGFPSVVALLLADDAHVDPNVADSEHKTALIIARNEGNEDVVALLLANRFVSR